MAFALLWTGMIMVAVGALIAGMWITIDVRSAQRVLWVANGLLLAIVGLTLVVGYLTDTNTGTAAVWLAWVWIGSHVTTARYERRAHEEVHTALSSAETLS